MHCLLVVVAAAAAVGGAVPLAPHAAAAEDGLVRVPSEFSFNDTLARLVDAIEAAGIAVPLVVDHAAAAANAGLELAPTTVVFFGNPVVGTPPMQSNQAIGLDLPLKMLVVEDPASGAVELLYQDPAYARARFAIADQDESFDAMATALANFAAAASGSQPSG